MANASINREISALKRMFKLVVEVGRLRFAPHVARCRFRRRDHPPAPALSKNKDGRVLPLSGELLEIVERAKLQRRLDCPYVFHMDREKVGNFKRSWGTVCKKAEIGKVLVHDLRRTAVRNMGAGIPDRIAMVLSGHKTRSVFDRYNIVREADLAAAAERLQAHLGTQPVQPKVTPMADYRRGGQ